VLPTRQIFNEFVKLTSTFHHEQLHSIYLLTTHQLCAHRTFHHLIAQVQELEGESQPLHRPTVKTPWIQQKPSQNITSSNTKIICCSGSVHHFNLEEILQKKYQTSKEYKSSADLSCIMKIVSPVLQVASLIGGGGTVVVA
jgi:hypothetical protein